MGDIAHHLAHRRETGLADQQQIFRGLGVSS